MESLTPDHTLEISRIDDGVVSLKVCTDEDPYLGPWFVSKLANAFERLTVDKTVRAIVLEGGTRYFSAGGSRDALLSADAQNDILNYVTEVPRLLLALPVPTVAAMEGHAIGGGLMLGLWCESAVLAEESLYGVNFMALGFTPGMGATSVLEEAVGAPLARELLFTGRLIKGRELKAAGGPLAYAVVPRTEVHCRAISIAREMAEVPRAALVLLKLRLAAKRRVLLDAAVKEEQLLQEVLFAREETRLQIDERYRTSDLAPGHHESK